MDLRVKPNCRAVFDFPQFSFVCATERAQRPFWGFSAREVSPPRDFSQHDGLIESQRAKLQIGANDTIKLELYEGCKPVTELSHSNGSIGNVVSIPTAISFTITGNGSQRPDSVWWGRDVLLTVTIGGNPVTRWLKFHNWS